MARLKTIKFDIDGIEEVIHLNCSTSGVFSSSINYNLAQKLNIPTDKLESSKLSDIENTILKAVSDYKNANTSYSLKIAIVFTASGDFISWETTPSKRGKFEDQQYFNNDKSQIGFGFKILIEEIRDGRKTYYPARIPHINYQLRDWDIKVENYIKSGNSIYNLGEYTIIDFTEEALSNLVNIKSQLKNASSYLYELLNSESLELILANQTERILNEKNNS